MGNHILLVGMQMYIIILENNALNILMRLRTSSRSSLTSKVKKKDGRLWLEKCSVRIHYLGSREICMMTKVQDVTLQVFG